MLEFKDFESKAEKGTQDLTTFFEEEAKTPTDEMVKLAEVYGEEKRSIKEAENKVEVRKGELAKQEATLFAMLEGLEMDSFSSKGYTYFRKVDSYASVDAEETKAAFEWIKEAGFGEIIKLTVNARSLTSVLKEVFETTGEIPSESDGIKCRTVNRVGVRKK